MLLAHDKEQAKHEYYSKTIDKSKHNTKHLWQTINDIPKYKTKTKCNVTSKTNENGAKITNPTNIGNLFNTYFSDIGKKLTLKI